MGAAASTKATPLAEVDIKKEIGVLYDDDDAKKAFKAHCEDDRVARGQSLR